MAATPRLTISLSSGAAAAVLLGLFLGGMDLCAGAAADPPLRLRLGLSEHLFLNLNENDARAAVQAWTQSIAAASHMEVAGGAQLLRSDEIVQAIANHTVDGFSITLPEYAKVAAFVDPVIFVDEASTKAGVEYLILVRQDSDIHDLAGLRGRGLLAWDYVSMALVPAWLETLLAASNLEAPDRFFGRVTKSTQVSQTVLPVFFGRAEACLVTRRAFDTMCELNPQLRQKLRVVVVSPQVQTALVGVHKDTPAEIKVRIRKALLEMDRSPGGYQMLNLFQLQRIVAMDSSSLRPTLDLLEQYERLRARHAGARR